MIPLAPPARKGAAPKPLHSTVRRHAPLLLLILLPLLPLWRGVAEGAAMGPWAQLGAMAQGEPAGPWDVLQMDGVLQSHAWRHLVFESWSAGRVPAWNPYVLMGTPLLANSQSGALYPPHILLGLLGFGAAVGGVVLAWFHLAVAGLGARALTLRLGASEAGGLVAGISFALSPFLLAWSALASVPATVVWIPVALACLRAGRPAPLSGAVAMLLLGGHLQFAAYGMIAIVVFGAGLVLAERRLSWKVPAGVALGVALALPQVLPALRFAPNSHRRTAPTAEGWAAYSASAVRPFELATLAAPYALGDPREEGPELAPGRRVSTYWPPLAKTGANLAESAVSLGPLVLVLLALAPWRRRETWAVAAVALVGLGLAMGPLSAPLYYGFPGWSSTGSPGRASVLFVLGACVLAGLGVRTITGRGLLRGLAFVVPAALLALLGPSLAGTLPEGIAALAAASLTTGFVAALIGGVLAFGAVAFGLSGKARAVALLPVAAALGALPLLPLLTMGKPPARTIEGSGTRVAVENDSWEILVRPAALFPPNTLVPLGIREVGGYDSLLDAGTKKLLDGANGGDSPPPANGNMMFVKPTANLAALKELGVGELYSRRPRDGSSESGAGFSVTPVGGVRLSLSGGKARVSKDDLSTVEIEATGPGRLVYRDRALPGWTATLDGTPAPLLEGPFLSVEVPEGPHRIAFRYQPPGFREGLLAAGVASLFLMGLALTDRRRPAPKVVPLPQSAEGAGATAEL